MAVIRFPSLVILSGATTSNIIGGFLFDNIEEISIYGDPAGLNGVVTVEVADTEPEDAVAGDFRELQSAGADVVVTSDKTVVIKAVSFRSMRLFTDAAPGQGTDETNDVVAKEIAVGRLF